MQKQAAVFGAEFAEGNVTRADLSKRPFRIELESESIETSTLIIASGASTETIPQPRTPYS